MSRVIIIDNMPTFKARMKSVFNDALRETATDILVEAKMKAPFKMGHLRAPSEPIKKIGTIGYSVGFDARYAAYQEAGGDGTRRVRKYTTAGTGAHFLENAGDRHANGKMVNTIKKHAQRVAM